MAYACRSSELSPVRPKLFGLVPRLEQASVLLREYLESRVRFVVSAKSQSKPDNESTECRRFLKRWNARDRNAGMVLGIRPGPNPRTVEIFAYIPGKGRVAAMPSIVTEGNPKLARIVTETAAGRPVQETPERASSPKTNAYGQTARRGFPPKEPTVFLPGQAAH